MRKRVVAVGYWVLAVFVSVAVLLAASSGWDALRPRDPFNRFAKAYNAYVTAENRGVVDLRAQREMRAAWRALEKAQGWPEEQCR